MCYPVCGMMHIKEPLLLFDKSSPCGGSGFPLSLSEWFFTICLTPYNVMSASLNKTFPPFLLSKTCIFVVAYCIVISVFSTSWIYSLNILIYFTL